MWQFGTHFESPRVNEIIYMDFLLRGGEEEFLEESKA